MRSLHISTLPDYDYSGIYSDTLKALLRGEPVDLEWAEIGLMVTCIQVRDRIRDMDREAQIAATLMRDPVQWECVRDDDDA